MEIHLAQKELNARLVPLYGDREAVQIADWVMENITGLRRLDRIVNKDLRLTPVQADIFWQYIKGLSNYRPVQYVLHESWFYGLRFYVDEQVLIPRPETEELVDWVRSTIEGLPGQEQPAGAQSATETRPVSNAATDEHAVDGNSNGSDSPNQLHRRLNLLDIGTGSGCIAISLQKNLPAVQVLACDVSPGALSVARRNAQTLGTPVDFFELDILDPARRASLPQLDFIVSNPPYIPVRDKKAMAPHVLKFEPHLALFVTDEDPLVFYRAIAELGRERLTSGGAVFAEIHEELGPSTRELFLSIGFQTVEVKKDMQGKDRMIMATR